MMRRLALCACLMLVGAGTGCRNMGMPRLFHPGPAAYQQAEAQRFDPYPELESGPPIDGARPREFDKPLPEPARARQVPWHWIQQ